MLISTPGYTLGSVPGSDPPRRPKLVPYPGTLGWWTFEPDGADKPSGSRRAALPAAAIEPVMGGFRIHLQADGQELFALVRGGGASTPDHVTRLSS